MFKNLVFTSAMVVACIQTYAQQQPLSIKVVDNQNNILAGATVKIGNYTEKTNKDGIATFTKSLHTTEIWVSYVGFQSSRHTFKPANSSQELVIQLYPSSITTAEAYVTATRAQENVPTTFTNLSKKDIARQNLGQDIPYLLDQTPSVVISSDAGAGIGYTNMTIRGSDNQRINVTMNGIPLNDAESMGSFFVNLPDFASSTESIQIQRGIGTSTNGAGSFGASLNIQTDALSEKPYAELNNTFGSYNTWKNTVKVGSGLINNKFAFNARLSRINSNGYVERAASDLQSFYVDGGYYGPKSSLKAVVFWGKEKTYQAWYGTPEPLLTKDKSRLEDYGKYGLELTGDELTRMMNSGRDYNYYTYPNQTDNYTQKHHQLHYSNAISDKLTFNSSLHYTRGYGYYEEMRLNNKLSHYNLEPVIFGTDTIKRTDLVRRRWLDNYFYGANTALNYKSDGLNVIFGAAYNQYRGDHYGEVIWAKYASNGQLGDHYYDGTSRKNDFSTFLKLNYEVDKWLFMADVQYRNVDYNTYGNDDKVKNYAFHPKFNFINPKAGATYRIDEAQNVYASYAFASKEPVRSDFIDNYNTGVTPKAEKMQDIEFGYRYKSSAVNIGTNGFAMLYKDQLIPTGALNDVGSSLRINVPDSYRIGLEFDGAWQISRQFLWKATASLSQNKIKNFQEDAGGELFDYKKTTIAKSPSVILSNELAYTPVSSLTFAVASKYVSKQYLDNSQSNDRIIQSFLVHNLRTTYDFSAFGIENIGVNLSVNNILNKKYSSNGFTWGYMDGNDRIYYNFYYPQAPTNFLLGLNVRF